MCGPGQFSNKKTTFGPTNPYVLKSKIEVEQLLQKQIEEHGSFSSAIPLSEGVWTNPPLVHTRLRRVIQIAHDLSRKPLNECRVLDLGCFEGTFALEFALQGAETIGIDVRENNIQKANFCKQFYNLDNLNYFVDDVIDMEAEKYGRFDIILCSGLLYHLTAIDAYRLLENMSKALDHLLILDTHIHKMEGKKIEVEGDSYWGQWHQEFTSEASHEEKMDKPTFSFQNNSSFRFTRPSLMNMMNKTGYSSVYECFNPIHIVTDQNDEPTRDRCTFVAVKDKQHKAITNPEANLENISWPERSLVYGPVQSKKSKDDSLLVKVARKISG